ncbi:MAG: hypothetical protein K2P38_02145 [Lachnospiraceae bacterium]|nr:hypothetical protein [Lachnospiraceae bacterium]
MAYTKKPLEDLNVIDDFLMNRLASDKEVGETFCRVVLSTLLQREIGKVNVTVQKVLPPACPDLKGIRLDVKVEEPVERVHDDGTKDKAAMNIYDIEPHLVAGTNLPRHNRFYQALADSSNLKSGENDYRHLPDLYVLMILDKDPFGYDYMMYRIRNKCEEVDELDYEDGLRFYYFYTGGNKGGNDQIKTMLRYIRNSREENATDSATKKIHKLAEKVKIHPEVRKSYMLWEEYVYLLKKELRPEVKEEVREEVKAEITEEFREKVKTEIKEKIREEVKTEIKEEIREEVRKENKKAAEEFDRFIELVQILTNSGRSDEISKAASDPDYREQLYRENNLV